jgi:hypothetical protein
MSAMEAEESGDATLRLEPRLIDVEIHAIDAFDLERDVLSDDFGNRA